MSRKTALKAEARFVDSDLRYMTVSRPKIKKRSNLLMKEQINKQRET